MLRVLAISGLLGCACALLVSCAGEGDLNAGGGGGGGGGGNDFAPKSFSATIWLDAAGETVTLDTTADGKLTGSFGALTAKPTQALAPTLDGVFNPETGAFSGSGKFNSANVSLSGSFPRSGVGGSITVTSQGKAHGGIFGIKKPNTIYFGKPTSVTNSYYASGSHDMPVGYIEGAGRLTQFTTWGGQPHDAYISIVARVSKNTTDGIGLIVQDPSLGAGSILDVVPPAELYGDYYPKNGECRLHFGEGALTFWGVSGRIIIDYVDNATGKIAFHTDLVMAKGARDVFDLQTGGIGTFEVMGDFYGMYADSTILGP
jgi:hypothetical protein